MKWNTARSKKEQTTDTNHYAESKKPEAKGYRLYNAVYIKFWKT